MILNLKNFKKVSLFMLLLPILTSCSAKNEEVKPQKKAPRVAAQKAPDKVTITQPWLGSESLIQQGQSVYKNACMVCHGKEGKGDGPAGKALKPPPQNLVEGKWKNGGSSVALFKTITNGIEGTSMATFKHLPVADRWALVHYIRSITNNRVSDTSSELESFGQSAK